MPAITRTKLNATRVDKAPAKASPYRLRDSEVPGLALRVHPSGLKVYEVHFDRLTAERIGKHPHMTLDVARARARARLGDYSKTGQRDGKPKRGATLRAFIDDRYKPWALQQLKTGARTIATIEAQFADLLDKPLVDVGSWAIEKWKTTRLKAGTNPSTVNRDLNRVKALLAKAFEWEAITENPLRTVKRAKGEDNNRVRHLSHAEEKALRTALAAREEKHRARRESGSLWREARGVDALPAHAGFVDHLQPMVLIALNTGLRRGELTSIVWGDVNLPGKMLSVRASYAKSGKARHVQLNREAVATLRIWRKQQPGDGRVFPLLDPKKSWGAVLEAAKIRDFRFHDLRHTFASNLTMAGVDLNTVRDLLGHASMAMTLRYAHLAPAHKAAAVERLVR